MKLAARNLGPTISAEGAIIDTVAVKKLLRINFNYPSSSDLPITVASSAKSYPAKAPFLIFFAEFVIVNVSKPPTMHLKKMNGDLFNTVAVPSPTDER